MDAILRTLAAPRRQEILRLIWERERSAGDIASQVDVSFSAVSQHLAKLLDVGVVEVRRDGRQRFYRVNRDALGPLVQYFEAFWTERLLRLKELAEREET
jgi:DNA-binding transcriptional ArsR family regulator